MNSNLVVPARLLLFFVLICVSATFESSKFERVVYPRVYDHREQRTRRSLRENVWKIVELGEWVLQLKSEGNLVIDRGVRAEWVGRDGNTTQTDVVECEHGRGVVRGTWTTSWTAVTLCGSMINGYMSVDGKAYTIRPVEANMTANAHVVSGGDDSIIRVSYSQ